MKLWIIWVFLYAIISGKKVKKQKAKKQDQSIENKELYEFHNVKENQQRESKDHHHDYKDITEGDYEKHDMGYHHDYSPIDENR
jgi:hypothetical protein